MRQKLGKIVKITIPLFLGIIIIYFLYRKTDLNELWRNIKDANWAILTFSLIFGLAGNICRGLRWELLIHPLGYKPKRSNLIYAVLGNYAVNFAIPRAGEIWRCGIVHQKEKIPFAKLIETMLIDRFFDPVMLFIIITLALVLNTKVFLQNLHQFQLPAWLTSWYFYVGCLLAVAIIVACLLFFKENFIVKKLREILKIAKDDLNLLRKMPTKTQFILYSFGIWTGYFLCFYVAFFAFDFTAHLGLSAALFIFVLGSLSMAIPSNGGLGPWQAAIVFGLCIFAVSKPHAEAFAIGVFAFQSLWQVLCGLFGIMMLSFQRTQTK
ncbi:dolichol-P-glucose synthetase [Bacteroidia bacterium]|nr:dolichol-P-glucose synthetase [Bacteroidia bacterium]